MGDGVILNSSEEAGPTYRLTTAQHWQPSHDFLGSSLSFQVAHNEESLASQHEHER